jgi:hypothetical protein
VQEYGLAIDESRKESISLRNDLEESRSEQHRLEDELEIRKEEIEHLNLQIRDSQKSRLESERLAENEVRPNFHAKY